MQREQPLGLCRERVRAAQRGRLRRTERRAHRGLLRHRGDQRPDHPRRRGGARRLCRAQRRHYPQSLLRDGHVLGGRRGGRLYRLRQRAGLLLPQRRYLPLLGQGPAVQRGDRGRRAAHDRGGTEGARAVWLRHACGGTLQPKKYRGSLPLSRLYAGRERRTRPLRRLAGADECRRGRRVLLGKGGGRREQRLPPLLHRLCRHGTQGGQHPLHRARRRRRDHRLRLRLLLGEQLPKADVDGERRLRHGRR